MISKAFQNIVTQMADVFPKKFGIVDSHGLVLANNGGEPTGDIIENLVYAATNNDKLLFKDGYTVRSMSNKPYAEYVVYVEGLSLIHILKKLQYIHIYTSERT